MKLSVSSYSFIQYIKAGKLSYIDCVDKAAELGFNAIEFIDLDGLADIAAEKELAGKIKERAEVCGLDINAYTIRATLYKDTESERLAEVERVKAKLDVAAALGAKVLRHDVCYTLGKTGASRSFDLMLPYIAESARKITEYGETLGIRTCTENHGLIAQDSDRVERLFNAVNHDNYGLLVDIGNFVCADEDPAIAVSKVAPYAFHVHVKDLKLGEQEIAGSFMTRGCRYAVGTAVGEGDVPVKRCLSILKKAGYDGYLSMEYEGREDCMTAIPRGLENLKKILAQIEWL